ncbi:peptidase domain-containing ABC transporter [Sphingomonas sp. QA11]|uniref:peptidase domain-containing ABC transporter n=1 Tax=Sphingomonas sp. QA11 TaxID=2950605 RepID=UPI00234B7A4C|nr:peptidase domain-containing ABC transporter [Sphingomonas sp. QA11]WCM25187.1 peptidase domain-containing ABC transporter [Sphingomonas sp. QA11]
MTAKLDLGVFSRSRIRPISQTEVAECGLACLAMVAGYHGLEVDLGTFRRRFAISSRGARLSSLIKIADSIGMSTRAIKVPLDRIHELEFPAVLHWNLNHYVVLEAVRGSKALIHDPAGASRWMPIAEVSSSFTGVALELLPSLSFETGDARQRLHLSQLWQRMKGLKRALGQTLILSIVLQAFLLASPYYMQLAIDSALPALDLNLLTVLAIGFGLFAIINAITALLRSFVLLSAGAAFGFGVASNIARRLFRLPIDWFERRQVGDILSRFQSITPIRSLLADGAVAAVVDGALAFLTLGFMVFYSPTLAMVSVSAFVIYGIVRWVSFPLQREAQTSSIITSSREQTVLIESLRGMTTLRMFNRETLWHALWQSKMTDAVNANVHQQRIVIWQAVTNTLVFGLENVVVIWLAIGFVIGGGFSIGMVVAYLAYKAQFLAAASSLIDKAISFRMLGLHLERLSDIALADEDAGFDQSRDLETPLRGRLELKGISYRYGPDDPLILRDLDLVIQPGESVAITGPSGGGKSTLAKILLGLLEPQSGEMLVDGLPLTRFGYRSYRDQVAGVLQDDVLFGGSIAENISMFDDAVDMDRVIAAARAASIDADIAAMTMAYETLVGDMGTALSGGQRQRVFLARALYRQPKMLIVDEGTSHLDEIRERRVNAAIAEMGITRVIIAHRKETIASADRVLMLSSGRLETMLETCTP